MPNPPVAEDDIGLFQCSCNIEDALVEEIYVRLRIIGKDIAEERKEDGSGWKAMGRPERERILKTLELLGLGIDSLLELIQD